MEEQDNCQFCGFPAVGLCPRCHMWYCPDHVQQTEPFVLCARCYEEDPNYLENNGGWIGPGLWADYRFGGTYQTIERQNGVKLNSSRDIWRLVERAYTDPRTGEGFWDIAESHF